MLTVAIPKRNKLQNIIVLTPKDGTFALAYSGRANRRDESEVWRLDCEKLCKMTKNKVDTRG